MLFPRRFWRKRHSTFFALKWISNVSINLVNKIMIFYFMNQIELMIFSYLPDIQLCILRLKIHRLLLTQYHSIHRREQDLIRIFLVYEQQYDPEIQNVFNYSKLEPRIRIHINWYNLMIDKYLKVISIVANKVANSTFILSIFRI